MMFRILEWLFSNSGASEGTIDALFAILRIILCVGIIFAAVKRGEAYKKYKEELSLSNGNNDEISRKLIKAKNEATLLWVVAAVVIAWCFFATLGFILSL